MFVPRFFSNVALSYTAESNFWKDRQLAALPAIPANGRPGESPLRRVGRQIHFVDPDPSSTESTGTDVYRNDGFFSPTIASHARINDLYSVGKNEPAVVLIQDVHLNPEAQENIAALLQSLIDSKKVDVIGVEGAFGDFDFSIPRSFPADVSKRVADDFFTRNKIGAPSYVGMTSSRNPVPMVGVDDLPHYKDNLRAYLNASKIKPQISAKLRREEAQLSERKKY